MRFIIVVGITPRLGVGAGRCNTHNTPLYNLFFPPSLDSHTPFCVCMHTVSLYTERERPVTMGRVNWACLTPFSTRYCFVLWKSTHTSRHFLASRADELLVFCAARWLRVQQRLKKKTRKLYLCRWSAIFSFFLMCTTPCGHRGRIVFVSTTTIFLINHQIQWKCDRVHQLSFGAG